MSVTAYIRVSTDHQDVTNQRHELETYAKELGLAISTWIEADGVSSRKSFKDRNLDQVLALRKGDVLLVTEFSRLARSVREVLTVVETLGERGVTTYVSKLRVRLNGKSDIATTAIVSSMALAAQIERDLISSRTREALAARKAQGKCLGMTAPNHDVAAIQGKAVEALKAKAAARAANLESLLRSMIERDLTQRAMVKELDSLGVSSPRGGYWSQATVCRMLKRILADSGSQSKWACQE